MSPANQNTDRVLNISQEAASASRGSFRAGNLHDQGTIPLRPDGLDLVADPIGQSFRQDENTDVIATQHLVNGSGRFLRE